MHAGQVFDFLRLVESEEFANAEWMLKKLLSESQNASFREIHRLYQELISRLTIASKDSLQRCQPIYAILFDFYLEKLQSSKSRDDSGCFSELIKSLTFEQFKQLMLVRLNFSELEIEADKENVDVLTLYRTTKAFQFPFAASYDEMHSLCFLIRRLRPDVFQQITESSCQEVSQLIRSKVLKTDSDVEDFLHRTTQSRNSLRL